MKLNYNDFKTLTRDEFDLLCCYAELEISFEDLYKRSLTNFDDFMSNESFNTIEDIDRLVEISTKWSHIIHAVKDKI